jgi:hypothetical protein
MLSTRSPSHLPIAMGANRLDIVEAEVHLLPGLAYGTLEGVQNNGQVVLVLPDFFTAASLRRSVPCHTWSSPEALVISRTRFGRDTHVPSEIQLRPRQ